MLNPSINEPIDLLCRVGCYGHVGRFRPMEPLSVERGNWVLCRTARGLECGEVLAPSRRILTPDTARPDTVSFEIDGQLIRRLTAEDRLVFNQLKELSQKSLADCQDWLIQNNHQEVLLDVEPLMDGRTLYFHFLGTPSDRVAEFLQSLVSIYQQQVERSRFAQLIEQGCGPGCGTETKSKCGSAGGCSVCVVVSKCKKPNAVFP